ncbi:MAG: glycosyl transferase [Deltaproteobacteria bacterium]|nr:glycosyl transferase [Deltaproteobacteria bacterium]
MADLAHLQNSTPHTRLLGSDRYHVLLSGAGTGVSSHDSVALTPWSADRTEDGDGFFIYLRDLDDGRLWSSGHEPVHARADAYGARYEPGVVRFERLDAEVATRLDVCVAPDADLEVRRLTLENRAARPRRIEVTTYAEVALIEPAAYAAHPAFAKLFVQTEYDAAHAALLAHRRPRSAGEHHLWLLHACAGPGAPLQYETDRVRFVGRGRTLAAPVALTGAGPLSGTVGSVLDPIVSLRRVVHLAPGETAALTILLGVAPTRTAALAMARRHAPIAAGSTSAAGATAGVFAAATERERTVLRALGITADQAERLQTLAGAMLYGDPRLRAPADVLRRAHGSPALLGTYGLRSDALLAVAHVRRTEDRALVAEVLAARAYWETKGLRVDLLVLCEGTALCGEVNALVGAPADAPGRVLVRELGDVPAADRDVIVACAHLVVAEALPDIGAEARRTQTALDAAPTPSSSSTQSSSSTLPPASTACDVARTAPRADTGAINGYGAFSADGSEYVITLDDDATGRVRRPPMPWVNVIANAVFGFLVSESGAACTWSRNSRENRLTPWYNDTVRDPHGEALYVRDDDTGAFWSPLPGPVTPGAACDAPTESTFEARHGLGYSLWQHRSRDLEHEVWTFVPQQRPDPVKITRIRLTNASDRPRRLSIFAYHRLVLGGVPGTSGRFVVTDLDAVSQALFARNRMNDEFADGVVFVAGVAPAGATAMRFTADRTAFLGRHGSPASPAAIACGGALDGTTGAALDPCAAVQMTVEIPARATVECAALLGEAGDAAQARTLVARYREPGAVERALAEARAFWDDLRAGIQIATPAPALDRMVNGWLPYQVLSCRLWGRSAFYQSGGAFGFRDQLQDSAAFTTTRPALTRAQILLHAAHQFVEGDVLHWWHPPLGRGIRTRFSDDLVWLPYVTAHYVRTTGDVGVLDEHVGFVTARPLLPGEDEAYLVPTRADEVADVYAHCCRALDRSLTSGAHGLPLMGTGDWNDGMNRVGREGRGESVWLAFFLYRVIDGFVPLCDRRGDGARAARYRAYQTRLRAALETAAWDGAWYRRAYYDDGTPLGSAANDECRIDALAQAWAVLSNAVPRARAAQAMDAVLHLLVDEEHGLIRLLTPPFDHDPHDPGYIKGYVPGIRENGGQYTHAALWVVEALAELGRRDRAAALLTMLSPVSHGATPAQVATYQVEPYIVAADVYGTAPHIGRGGWTWYTGSASWMYRIAVESLLGVRLEGGDTLIVAPRIPDAWPGFTVRLRLPDGRGDYEIVVTNPTGLAAVVTAVAVDGAPGAIVAGAAHVVVDGAAHRVDVVLGAADPSA